ncbi:MAG: DUF262 domain-containing protein [Phycisphaerales bacterium JB040]
MHQPDPQSRSYDQILSGIKHGTVKVPQFQREFVWTREKSAKLIDSILKGYPIGTFILWKTREQLRAVRNIGAVNLPDTPDGDYAEQVLDGQQRLTSLYAAVHGLTIERSSGALDDFSSICIDLDAELDTETPVALHAAPAEAEENRFVRLVDVLAEDFDFLSGLSKDRREQLRVYSRRIKEYRFSVILIQDAPIDVATEIFTRINVTGKPLSLFEIMVAKTYDHKSGFDLAQKYNELVEELQTVGYETLPPAAILQLASLMICGEARKKDILRLPTKEFRDIWPRVGDAVKSACDYFRGAYRLPASRLLPYGSLIIPFAAFFDVHPDKPNGEQTARLRELFWRISLTGRYTSAVETKLAQDYRKVLAIAKGEEPEYDPSFAIDVSPEAIDRHGFFRTSRSFVKAILCLLVYQQPRSFDDDGIVKVGNDWLKQSNSRNYHHFYPKATSTKLGIEKRRLNHIANITIVDDFLNKRKIRTRLPSDYLTEFKAHNLDLQSTMDTHLVDLSEGVWDDDYEAFLASRCKRISEALQAFIPTRSIDDAGAMMTDDDSDPNAEADEQEELEFDSAHTP